MNKVEPIRNPEKIAQIKNLLKAKDDPRDYLLFTLGINFALRIQDLLSLKVKDVLEVEDGKIKLKEYVYLRERKTGKQKRIRINQSAREALEHYFSRVGEVDPEDYLFRSHRSDKPLDRSRAYRLVREWTEAVGLTQGRYGTHSLRKTWGYQARKQGVPIELIMEKLGHSSPSVTKRYIGITDDEIEDVENHVNL